MSSPARNPVDHSLTYRGGLRNLPHRRRLRAIVAALTRGGAPAITSFADVGCSNGYVTAILQARLGPARTVGFDHVESHLERGRREHPQIEFRSIDLNRPLPAGHETFDLVTCFETLEHVGRLEPAIANLLAMTRAGGTLFITIPIESGPRGLLKFLIKVGVFRYSLDELPARPRRFWSYLGALAGNRTIASFRDQRDGWGTHFGFDWREVERILRANGAAFESRSDFTTRFVVVRR
ncbi:MAG TPA: class I SAM-dependent methyltransferase [Candidatus Krumholzibacteria bacterium]|nr:class I SAM-dependent methyltransferase [Candidatus Krumholzibacteria bacterium]